jgi:hypothetical protein
MSSIIIDDQTLKELLKEALIEFLQKRPEVLRDVLAEAVEDIGLAQAIREGLQVRAEKGVPLEDSAGRLNG